jgi:membrane-associated phospholipid phosphatase
MPIVLPPSLDRFDAEIDAIVRRCTSSRAETAAHVLSSLADRSVIWAILATIRALRGRPGDIRAAGRMTVVVGLESAMVHGLVKRAFARERPPPADVLRFGVRRPPSSAFPSGHAASATTAALLLSDGTRWGPVLFPLAAVIGWSRVHTRLHHASDVLGGAVLGWMVGSTVRRLVPLGGRVR